MILKLCTYQDKKELKVLNLYFLCSCCWVKNYSYRHKLFYFIGYTGVMVNMKIIPVIILVCFYNFYCFSFNDLSCVHFLWSRFQMWCIAETNRFLNLHSLFVLMGVCDPLFPIRSIVSFTIAPISFVNLLSIVLLISASSTSTLPIRYS